MILGFLISLVCGLGVLVLIAVVIAVIMKSGERDVVSSARQGWINRRSEQDKEGW